MSSRSLLVTLFHVLLLTITSMTPLNAKSVYVSSSIGDDSFDGLTPRRPRRSLADAIASYDTIYLKAGDIFYCSLYLAGKVITRYGEGRNPCLCGYRRVNGKIWSKVGENLWRINLRSSSFSGFDPGGASKSNDICCIHEYDKDLIHGRKVCERSELKSNWDFWQTSKIDGADASDYDHLILYLLEDPNALFLELSVYDMAVSAKESLIDGVNFIGFGFGMSLGSGMTVRNCHLDAIGGRMISEGSSYICYGNGIEFYVSSDISDCLVENCWISRCYDCGVTIQGQNSGQATPRNIIVRNNLIENCCQAWEDFLRNDRDVFYINCRFEHNVVLNSGESGFGYPASRFKHCHILGNNTEGDRKMIIASNTFIGGNYYCSGSYNGKYKSNVWRGNECYISPSSFLLSNYEGSCDVITVPAMSVPGAMWLNLLRYRQLTGDVTTSFHVEDRNELYVRARLAHDNYLYTHTF